MINRKECCPDCGSKILARTGDNKIFCLNQGCTWTTEVKRKDDIEKIPEIHLLKKLWQ